tara:strand:- start:647 stop:850 length:204 start_codon:yes stop_codon:yes gene_type:complete
VNDVNEKDIIHALRTWSIEVESFRNDGWTRYHYLSKLMKVKEYVDEHLGKYESVQKERFSSDQSRSS